MCYTRSSWIINRPTSLPLHQCMPSQQEAQFVIVAIFFVISQYFLKVETLNCELIKACTSEVSSNCHGQRRWEYKKTINTGQEQMNTRFPHIGSAKRSPQVAGLHHGRFQSCLNTLCRRLALSFYARLWEEGPDKADPYPTLKEFKSCRGIRYVNKLPSSLYH